MAGTCFLTVDDDDVHTLNKGGESHANKNELNLLDFSISDKCKLAQKHTSNENEENIKPRPDKMPQQNLRYS